MGVAGFTTVGIDVDVTVPDTANIASLRRALLSVAGKDKRVLTDPAAIAFVSTFGATTVTLELRVWVKTPDYRPALRDLKEAAKTAVNKLLAAKDEGVAEVSQAPDPHVTQSGAQTPE